MAQDFCMNPVTNDWDLVGDNTIRLCDTVEELTRQRVLINLRMFRGEWFADINYGVPYFESVYGKGTRESADAAFRSAIKRTEGVVGLPRYESELDPRTRVFKLDFAFESESGKITDVQLEF